MSERLAIGSGVLLDDLRGHEAAAEFLEGCREPLALTAISVAEHYGGVRDGERDRALPQTLSFDRTSGS